MVEKISKDKIEPKEDPCGLLRELYSSENLSIAHDVVLGKARKHKHIKMEEVYYVEKGSGKLIIGDEVLSIKTGDLVAIPKNTLHYLKKENNKDFEVLVITYPKFDADDLIYE